MKTKILENICLALDNNKINNNGMIVWGQFINKPAEHQQSGLYGTCSALIIYSLNGEGYEQNIINAFNFIKQWWENRKNDNEGAKWIVQNLRLSYCLLSLKFYSIYLSESNKDNRECESIINSIVNKLMNRMKDNLWGSYYENENNFSQKGCYFTTSYVLLSICYNDDSKTIGLKDTFTKLEEFIIMQEIDNINRPTLNCIAAIAVCFSMSNHYVNNNTFKFLKKVYRNYKISIDDFAYYFYSFNYKNTSSHITEYCNDYFIVPLYTSIPSLATKVNCPSSVKKECMSVKKVLENTVRDNLLKNLAGELASTKHHAWVSIYLNNCESIHLTFKDKFLIFWTSSYSTLNNYFKYGWYRVLLNYSLIIISLILIIVHREYYPESLIWYIVSIIPSVFIIKRIGSYFQ